MRAAAYVRVSTSRQVKLQTIEQQLERVQKRAQEKGGDLPQENIFRDDGYSGTTLKRPALDALRDKARLRELEVVVVLSPDRLARNYVHQMVLIEEFEKGGCRVEFVERPMSSEPDDQLLLQIRGAVAEYERTLLSERMRRGRLAKYKAGLLLPWTHVPYGLRVDPFHAAFHVDVGVQKPRQREAFDPFQEEQRHKAHDHDELGETDWASDGGGGLRNISGLARLRNTLVAGNTDPGGKAPDCWGTLALDGYNLFGSAAGCMLSRPATPRSPFPPARSSPARWDAG
jgi:DNA invertase Pin-like site-specific DNA recombinase